MELYPERVDEYRCALAAAGFEREDSRALEIWTGPVTITWIDPERGESCVAEHRVRIVLWPGFPIRKPSVFPAEGSPLDIEGRHRGPVENGALCLWPETERRGSGWGWHPSIIPEELLARIREWFVHYHLDDWGPDDRPPDLHLQFPRPNKPELMLISDDWTPPDGEEFGRFGIWDSNTSRYAFAGHPVGGVGDVPRTHKDRILGALNINKGRFTRPGAWFRLSREPRPRHNLRTLVAEIDTATGHEPGWALARLRRLFSKPPYKPHRIVIALGYRSRGGEAERWLFLRVEPQGQKPLKFGYPEELERYEVFAYETAPCGRDDLMRRTGHVAETLTGKRVLLLGLGALGSSIALLLAKSGVPSLRLVDRDWLRPTNTVRHEGGLWDIGREKTLAVWWAIYQHAPDCEVETADESWDPNILAGWMREADVVVDATAHETFSMLVNEIALREGKPVVYAFTRRRAAVGEVLIVRPGIDPCVTCHIALARDSGYPVVPAGDEGEFIEAGCGVPTIQASAVDVELTAALAGRTVLRLLQGRADSKNHLLLVNDPLPDAFGVLTIEGQHGFQWRRVPCSSCGGA
jgi:molybdopterin/thiamine biosynthesis adenylyltransferase